MTANDALKAYKAQEIDEDREYMLSILEEEKKAEDRIKAIIAVWWATKKDRRKLYKSMNETLDELFDTLDEDFAVEFPKRYESGYLHSSYIAQMLQQEFSEVPKPGDYNIKWHLGGASYLDDMKYYRNRLFDSMKRELERMMILDAPANIAIDSATKPFKTLRNSTKALVDTECVYAERQGMKEAYIKHDAERYRYIATLDTLTCSVCGSLDGNTFELAKAQVGVNYPPIHKWCRCTVIPVFDDFDSNSRVARDENGNNIEVSMTYDEWKERYGDQRNPRKGAHRDINEEHRARTYAEIHESAMHHDKVLDKYVKNGNKWSGKTIVVGKDDVSKAYPNGDIQVVEDCSDIGIIHELLHTRSYVNYGYDVYLAYQPTEELATELFAREIAKKEGYNVYAAHDDIIDLLKIKERAKINMNDFEFASEFYHVPINKREEWILKRISSANISETTKGELRDIFSKYIGENL